EVAGAGLATRNEAAAVRAHAMEAAATGCPPWGSALVGRAGRSGWTSRVEGGTGMTGLPVALPGPWPAVAGRSVPGCDWYDAGASGPVGGTYAVPVSSGTSVTEQVQSLVALPGVAEAVDQVRTACTELRWHQALRRRIPEAAAESRVRGATATA